MAIAHVIFSDANVVANDGFHDLIDVHIPEGCLLKPIRPAALSCRTHMLGRILDILSGLLGQKAPEFMTAAGFSDSPHFMYSGKRTPESQTGFMILRQLPDSPQAIRLMDNGSNFTG